MYRLQCSFENDNAEVDSGTRKKLAREFTPISTLLVKETSLGFFEVGQCKLIHQNYIDYLKMVHNISVDDAEFYEAGWNYDCFKSNIAVAAPTRQSSRLGAIAFLAVERILGRPDVDVYLTFLPSVEVLFEALTEMFTMVVNQKTVKPGTANEITSRISGRIFSEGKRRLKNTQDNRRS